MFKKFTLFAGICAFSCFFLLFFSTSLSYAGEASTTCYPVKNSWNSSSYIIKTDKVTAKADGVDDIAVSPARYSYSQDYSHAYYKIIVSGSGNSINPAVSHNVWEPYFKLTSTTPGVKTITAQSSINDTDWYNFPICANGNWDYTMSSMLSLNVAFTDPNPKQSSPAPGNSPASRTTNSSATTVSVPTLNKIRIGNEQVSANKLSTIDVDTKSELVYSGKTIANGKVTLFFHSDPFEESTTADKDGNWSYRLESGKLPAGEHSLQIAVTDPSTNQTSAKSDPFKFNIKQAAVAGDNKKESFLTKYLPYLATVLFVVLLGAATGIYVILKKRKKAEMTPNTDIARTNLQ